MPEHVEVAMTRLLSLVSWVGEHPGQGVDEVAAHFGRSPEQLLRDVEVLGSVGDSLPGSSFEVDWDLLESEGRLRLHTTMGVDLPPRLTGAEQTAVLVGLRAIAPALDDDLRERLPRTAMAVAALGPGGHDVSGALAVSGETPRDPRMDAVHRALEAGRRLAFVYRTPDGRSASREVDPWELRRGPEGWLLRGWCHTAQGLRTFRVDRMEEPRVLDVGVDGGAHVYTGNGQHVRVRLDRGAQWVADELAVAVPAQDEDSVTVDLEVWDTAWLESLLVDVSPHLLEVDPPEPAVRARERAREALDVWERVLGAEGARAAGTVAPTGPPDPERR